MKKILYLFIFIILFLPTISFSETLSIEAFETTDTETLPFYKVIIASESETPTYYNIAQATFNGKKYKIRVHYCNHDKGLPCTEKILFEN